MAEVELYEKPFDFDGLLRDMAEVKQKFENQEKEKDNSPEWLAFANTARCICDSVGNVAGKLKDLSANLSTEPGSETCAFVHATGELGSQVVSVLSSSKLESACRILSFAPYAGIAFQGLAELLEAIRTSRAVDKLLTDLFLRVQRLIGYLQEVLRFVAEKGSDAAHDKTFCILSSVLQKCVDRIKEIKEARGGFVQRLFRSGDQKDDIEKLEHDIETTLLERGTIDTLKNLGCLQGMESQLNEMSAKIDELFQDYAEYSTEMLQDLADQVTRGIDQAIRGIDNKIEQFSTQTNVSIKKAKASIVMAISEGNVGVCEEFHVYFQAASALQKEHYDSLRYTLATIFGQVLKLILDEAEGRKIEHEKQLNELQELRSEAEARKVEHEKQFNELQELRKNFEAVREWIEKQQPDAPEEHVTPYKRGERPKLAPRKAKEAIVYLPGISPGQRERNFSSLLCSALNSRSHEQFTCNEAGIAVRYNGGGQEWYSKKFMISKIKKKEYVVEDGKTLQINDPYPIVDVYWLDCQETFRGEWNWQTELMKSFQLTINCTAFLIGGLATSIWRLFFRSGKRSEHLLQLIFITFVGFLAVVVYFLLLVWAAFASAFEMIDSKFQSLHIAQAFAIVTFVADLCIPGSLRVNFDDTILLFNSLMIYFTDFGDRKRRALIYQLSLLLKRIQNLDDGNRGPEHPYERIHLVGASFGSCLAIDALFPKDGQPRANSESLTLFRPVKHLVTLGCPFDLIRTFLPSYYCAGRYCGAIDLCWTNIFIPEDFLSSNFRNDDDKNDPAAIVAVDGSLHQDTETDCLSERSALLPVTSEASNRCGLPNRNIAFSNWVKPESVLMILVKGIISHSRYFDKADDPDMICSRLIDAVFENPPNDRHWIAQEWDDAARQVAAGNGKRDT